MRAVQSYCARQRRDTQSERIIVRIRLVARAVAWPPEGHAPDHYVNDARANRRAAYNNRAVQ